MHHFGLASSLGERVSSCLVVRDTPVALVEMDQPGLERLLRHALGGHASVLAAPTGTAPPGLWTIAVLSSDRFHEHLDRLRNGAPGAGEGSGLADYWRADFSTARLRGGGSVSAVHHRAPLEALTLFDGESRAIIYLRPAHTPPYLPHLEHLVSHLLRLDGWDRGFVEVHGAFLSYQGKGVALIGPRRAGKTSMAMHLLGRGARLLGSDMAQIRMAEGGGIEAASIPHLCRITRETVWDSGWLAQAIGSRFDRNADYLHGPLFSHGKYEFYDPTLDEMLRRRAGIASMPLDAIFFPRFDVETRAQRISAPPEREGALRLMRSIRNDRPLADWLPFDLSARERAEAELGRKLASGGRTLPAFDIDFGRESSLDWAAIDGVIDAIPRSDCVRPQG